jgi:hypothetical protein
MFTGPHCQNIFTLPFLSDFISIKIFFHLPSG